MEGFDTVPFASSRMRRPVQLLRHANLRRMQSKPLPVAAPQAKAVAETALAFLAGFNRRTLDMIASRIYFYFSLAHERLGSLASIRRWARDGQLAASTVQCFAGEIESKLLCAPSAKLPVVGVLPTAACNEVQQYTYSVLM